LKSKVSPSSAAEVCRLGIKREVNMTCTCQTCRVVTRRSVVAGLACVAVMPAAAAAQARSTADDERYMRGAIEEARKAGSRFGAVIVRDGAILARGHSLVRAERNPTAHGEMVAIRHVVAKQGGQALRGATLYTTGEPCPMCMGAILWSRIGRLVFAVSIAQIATQMHQIMVTSEELAAKASFVPIEITGGVLADEAMALFAKK
jgi:tRNA(adenine34) deaminase